MEKTPLTRFPRLLEFSYYSWWRRTKSGCWWGGWFVCVRTCLVSSMYKMLPKEGLFQSNSLSSRVKTKPLDGLLFSFITLLLGLRAFPVYFHCGAWPTLSPFPNIHAPTNWMYAYSDNQWKSNLFCASTLLVKKIGMKKETKYEVWPIDSWVVNYI